MDGGPGRRGRRPLRKGGIAAATTQASGAQRSVRARGREGWAGIGAKTIPKGGPPPRLPGQRLAKRKARKEKLVKFDFCPTTSECSTAHNVRKSQQSPARAPVGITLTEQHSLEPRPAARQGASRARNCAAIKRFFDGSTAVYLRLSAAAARRLPPAHACGRSLFGVPKRKWGWKAIDLHRYPRPVGRPPADAIRRKPRPLGGHAKEKRSHVSRF